MVVSTIYDAELNAKVFQVRGNERYNKSTLTTCEVEYTANHKSYLSLNLAATVKGNYGISSVVFYSNDDVIGIVPCNEGTHEVTLDDVHADYVYQKIYAKYIGNSQCLSSKSPITELEILEPEIPASTITLNNTNTWFSSGSAVTITGTLASDGTGLSSKSVKVYVNDELLNTRTTTSNGSFTTDFSSLEEGKYDVAFVFEGDDTHTDVVKETAFEIGYNVTVSAKYQKLIVGSKAVFEVSVKSFADEPIPNQSITLEDS